MHSRLQRSRLKRNHHGCVQSRRSLAPESGYRLSTSARDWVAAHVEHPAGPHVGFATNEAGHRMSRARHVWHQVPDLASASAYCAAVPLWG